MYKIGIVGSGVMGCGIASLFSVNGLEVIITDKNSESLIAAKSQIKRNNMMYVLRKGMKSIKPVSFTHEIEKFAECNIIIEAISENLHEKEMLIKKMGENENSDRIIVSNTSCISIEKLANFYSKPSNVIGVHFMNPVNMIDTFEIIKTKWTSYRTIETIKQLLERVEKKYYIVNDSPGFVSNRISHLYMNEAAKILDEKIADVKSIDGIFRECYGHKMGPLETADLIGIDVVVDTLHELYAQYQDEKYKCCVLLETMVQQGELGCKCGKGFYTYD